MSRVEPLSGWPAFSVWALCGALWTFSFLSFAGPLLWPLAIGLTWFATRKTPKDRDLLGLLAGLGLFILYIGLINVGSSPCSESGIAFPDDGQSSCGGSDARPWLLVGLVALSLAILLYSRSASWRPETAVGPEGEEVPGEGSEAG